MWYRVEHEVTDDPGGERYDRPTGHRSDCRPDEDMVGDHHPIIMPQ